MKDCGQQAVLFSDEERKDWKAVGGISQVQNPEKSCYVPISPPWALSGGKICLNMPEFGMDLPTPSPKLLLLGSEDGLLLLFGHCCTKQCPVHFNSVSFFPTASPETSLPSPSTSTGSDDYKLGSSAGPSAVAQLLPPTVITKQEIL